MWPVFVFIEQLRQELEEKFYTGTFNWYDVIMIVLTLWWCHMQPMFVFTQQLRQELEEKFYTGTFKWHDVIMIVSTLWWCHMQPMFVFTQQLRQELEEKFYTWTFNWSDIMPNDCAALLKQFLRELPTPLLTYDYLEAFPQVERESLFVLHVACSVLTPPFGSDVMLQHSLCSRQQVESVLMWMLSINFCMCWAGRGGDVDQLVVRQTGTSLRQVWFPGAERDFFPRVQFQCGLSYSVCTTLGCDCVP